MKLQQVKQLEKVMGQMEGLHKEVTALAKKSSNDALNKFKLKLVNTAIVEANAVLGTEYQPFKDFVKFDEDDVPSNSDVALVVSQYLEELERLRSDNIRQEMSRWSFIISDSGEKIRTAPPKKINEKK
ncbi:hypothetical protein [Methyloferula stellata]|uniref:hypothetical protein n=1 Tax=Methyloferula stellata TaxID=876270 RepID=UPI00058D3FCB|nr:hypothetical protein [Methyloferula stellata]